MGGFPLGDLYHWFPEEYECWKAQENAEQARISCWLNSGRDPIFTDVNEQTVSAIPSGFSLSQNYPNPFNPSSQIGYSIARTTKVTLRVFDVLGREIQTLVNAVKSPGQYTVIFNAQNLSSGIYFYQLEVKNFVETKKLLLIK